MRNPPTRKSSGPAHREARLEGRSEARSAGTDDPSLAGLRTAGPVGGSAGPGTSGPAASATRQGGQAAQASFGSLKAKKVVGPKIGPGSSGIGRSGRGAPMT